MGHAMERVPVRSSYGRSRAMHAYTADSKDDLSIPSDFDGMYARDCAPLNSQQRERVQSHFRSSEAACTVIGLHPF